MGLSTCYSAMEVDYEQVPTAFVTGNASDLPLEHPQQDIRHDKKPLTEEDAAKPQYKLRHILSGHTRSISSLKFSPDGFMVASSGMSVTCC